MSGKRHPSRPARRFGAFAVLGCLALAALVAAGATARADAAADQRACTNISFRPLEVSVPACSRLIDGGLSGRALFIALRRRADAYHYGAQLGSAETSGGRAENLARALADLDRAAGLGISGSDAQQPPFWLDGPVDLARGEVLYQLGRFTAAVEAYARVLDASGSDYPPARFGRVLALRQLGQTEAALADMDALVAAAPQSPKWRFLRGQLREDLGRREAALADYRAVVELDPDHGAARLGVERLAGPAAAD